MFKLFHYCIYRARHNDEPGWVELEGISDPVRVEKGEFITGRHALYSGFYQGASSSRRKSKSTLWRRLKKLEDWGYLNIKSNTKFSRVTVVNYGDLPPTIKQNEQDNQKEKQEDSQKDEQALNNSCTSDEHKQECKEANKVSKRDKGTRGEKKEENGEKKISEEEKQRIERNEAVEAIIEYWNSQSPHSPEAELSGSLEKEISTWLNEETARWIKNKI